MKKIFVFALMLSLPLAAALAFAEEPVRKISAPDASELSETGKDGVLHGDTSVPDEELLELHGDKTPDEVFLKTNCKKMPPVWFPHKDHVDRRVARCGNCHHKDPKDIKGCASCHTPEPEDEKTPKYDDAHHGVCRDCHRANTDESVDPPTKCLGCHRKENTEKSGSDCPK